MKARRYVYAVKCANILRHTELIGLMVQFEVEGTFETGILAASWNPDESVVAIVTGVHPARRYSMVFISYRRTEAHLPDLDI